MRWDCIVLQCGFTLASVPALVGVTLYSIIEYCNRLSVSWQVNMTDQNIEETYQHRYRQFTENLRSARKEADKTQVEVAKYLNTTQAYVSKYESGDLRLDVIQLFALAKFYNKPIEDFFVGIE